MIEIMNLMNKIKLDQTAHVAHELIPATADDGTWYVATVTVVAVRVCTERFATPDQGWRVALRTPTRRLPGPTGSPRVRCEWHGDIGTAIRLNV